MRPNWSPIRRQQAQDPPGRVVSTWRTGGRVGVGRHPRPRREHGPQSRLQGPRRPGPVRRARAPVPADEFYPRIADRSCRSTPPRSRATSSSPIHWFAQHTGTVLGVKTKPQGCDTDSGVSPPGEPPRTAPRVARQWRRLIPAASSTHMLPRRATTRGRSRSDPSATPALHPRPVPRSAGPSGQMTRPRSRHPDPPAINTRS